MVCSVYIKSFTYNPATGEMHYDFKPVSCISVTKALVYVLSHSTGKVYFSDTRSFWVGEYASDNKTIDKNLNPKDVYIKVNAYDGDKLLAVGRRTAVAVGLCTLTNVTVKEV